MWNFHLASVGALALLSAVSATDILKTNGFSSCIANPSLQVNNVDISFDRSTNEVTFDVSGTSSASQDVTATLIITAYGNTVYSNSFDPCSSDTYVQQLCPVPAGSFSAKGTQQIPSSYVDMIPSIAYTIPDLEGNAQLILKAKDGQELACIESGISNGKSVTVPAVSYVAAGVAVVALAFTAVGAVASGAHPGSSSASPGFMEVMWWFQGMAMNGMHSVEYPTVYRSFCRNFGFSTGLIPWSGMQHTIDSFREHTGGNLTNDNYDYLKNATLTYGDNTTSSVKTSVLRRGLFLARDVVTSVNGTGGDSSSSGSNSKEVHFVKGIQAYVEQLSIPQSNTFMTILMIFAIVISAIVVGILLFKVILEGWALIGKFPKSLVTFRKEYWRVMFQTITSLVLLMYGIWTLYCIYQFTHGDSWAAKLLAGLTLGIFTALLGWYTFRIWSAAKQYKKLEGDESSLYENKEIWKKYHIFYGDYKRGCWWLFIPAILYMFTKGCILAAADGHGLVQTVGQLAVEALMLLLLLWARPFNRRSGNWINIIIQVVRVLSVVCILVFVQELGITQTTKTITGIVLIAVQAGLTCILAILIAVNSIIACVRQNPHRLRRKEAEKRKTLDLDEFADLHPSGNNPFNNGSNKNAFVMQPQPYHAHSNSAGSNKRQSYGAGYEPIRYGGGVEPQPYYNDNNNHNHNNQSTNTSRFSLLREDSQEGLLTRGSASRFGHSTPAPAAAAPSLTTPASKGQYRAVSYGLNDGDEDGASPPPSFVSRESGGVLGTGASGKKSGRLHTLKAF